MSTVVKPQIFAGYLAPKQIKTNILCFGSYAPTSDVDPDDEGDDEELLLIRRKRRAAARNLDARLKAQGLLL